MPQRARDAKQRMPERQQHIISQRALEFSQALLQRDPVPRRIPLEPTILKNQRSVRDAPQVNETTCHFEILPRFLALPRPFFALRMMAIIMILVNSDNSCRGVD